MNAVDGKYRQKQKGVPETRRFDAADSEGPDHFNISTDAQ